MTAGHHGTCSPTRPTIQTFLINIFNYNIGNRKRKRGMYKEYIETEGEGEGGRIMNIEEIEKGGDDDAN